MQRDTPLYDDTPHRGASVERQPPDAALTELGRRLPRQVFLGTEGWADARWRGLIYSRQSGTDGLRLYGLTPYSKHPLLRMTALPYRGTPYRPGELLHFLSSVEKPFRFMLPVAHKSLDPMIRDARRMGVGENRDFLRFDAEAWLRELEPAHEMLEDSLGPVVLRMGQFDSGLLKRWQHNGELNTRLEAFLMSVRAFIDERKLPLTLALEIQNGELLTPRVMKMLVAASMAPVVRLSLGMPIALRQVNAIGYWQTSWQEHYAEPPRLPLLVNWAGSASLMFGYRRLGAKSLVASDPVTRATIVDMVCKSIAAGRQAWVWAGNRAEGSAPLTLEAIASGIVARRENSQSL